MTRMLTTLAAAGALALAAGAASAEDGTWTAELMPMNADTAGSEAAGTATLTAAGDTLTIRIDATGTTPGIVHLQHFHGFAEGGESSACPGLDADTNDDGIIDLIETEPAAGTTMVPFHGDPASMAIEAEGYPTADDEGAYSYEQEVSLPDLETAFAGAFPGQELDFGRRVVFLHGVAEDTDLPDTVQSLGDVPAHVTLPIACGVLEAAAE